MGIWTHQQYWSYCAVAFSFLVIWTVSLVRKSLTGAETPSATSSAGTWLHHSGFPDLPETSSGEPVASMISATKPSRSSIYDPSRRLQSSAGAESKCRVSEKGHWQATSFPGFGQFTTRSTNVSRPYLGQRPIAVQRSELVTDHYRPSVSQTSQRPW